MTNLTIDENIISHTSHPGKLVEREIEARNWTQKYFAELMGVTTADVNNLIKGRKNITPRMAVRIGTTFGTSAEVWIGLQNMYDMRVLHEDKKEREKIEQIKKRIAVFSYDFSREPAYA